MSFKSKLSSGFKTAKRAVSNAIITGVQGTFSASHVAFRYGIDVVEISEASFMKRATAQSSETTIKERRNSTNRIRLENKRTYNEVVSKVKSAFAMNDATTDLMVEQQAHANA